MWAGAVREGFLGGSLEVSPEGEPRGQLGHMQLGTEENSLTLHFPSRPAPA